MTPPREVIFDLWPILHDLVRGLLEVEDDDLATAYSVTVERRSRPNLPNSDLVEWETHAGADDDYDDYRIRAVRL